MYLFHACRRLHPKVVTATVFHKGLFILFPSSLINNQLLCLMYAWVFSSAPQYIEIALRLLKKFDFSSCVFSTVFTSIFPFYFLRWSLESNWWNSLTKFYSIKSLMTAGVSNILCPFISMPSIDSSSDCPFFPLCFLDITFSLINFFPLMLLYVPPFPITSFLCHNFLSNITDFISLSEIYYTYILNVVDESN